ncbi:MAG TPA: hypothetical protein VN285_03385, partial [Candidatus Deferrimicrobium sp.]|nr:hypothetical protein [Candidatus Deferrimicrobium sp.]
MDFYLAKVIISFLTGGFLIFLALTVTRDNFTSRLNRVTGALFFFAGLGALFIGLGAIIERSVGAAQFELSAFYDLHYLYELLFPLLLFLSWIFPIDRFKTFRRRRLRFLIFVPQVMHLVLLLAFQKFAAAVHYLKAAGEEGGFGGLILRPLSEIASLLFLMVGLIQNYQEVIFGGLHLLYLAAAAYFFETGKKLVSSPTLLTQTRLVAWGIRVAGALYTAALISSIVAPKRFSPDLMAGLLLAALLAWSAMLIIATIRHQFLNVRLVLRQSFVYTITSGLLVGTYVVIVVQSKKILTPMFGEQAEMISYALIVLVLMLFQPINNWIDNVIRAMFIRTRTDPRNVLERFSRQVISLFDPEKLRQIIEETLKTTLLVEHVHFVLFDDRVGEYAIVPGEDHPRRIVLERDDLMLRGINLLDTPTYMHSLADYREGSPLATFLDDRRARLILPLKDANSLLGFVALSDK